MRILVGGVNKDDSTEARTIKDVNVEELLQSVHTNLASGPSSNPSSRSYFNNYSPNGIHPALLNLYMPHNFNIIFLFVKHT